MLCWCHETFEDIRVRARDLHGCAHVGNVEKTPRELVGQANTAVSGMARLQDRAVQGDAIFGYEQGIGHIRPIATGAIVPML